MFADPIVFPNNGSDKNHVRTALKDGIGEFTWRDPSGNPQIVTIKQSLTTKRFRREVRVSRSHIAADPLTATNTEVGASVYLVMDEPRAGFSDTDLNDMVCALCEFLTGSAPTDTGPVLRVLAGEY